MTDPIRHRATASDDTLPPGLELDFEAIDEAGDELLDRQLFKIREAMTDYRDA